MAVTHQSVLPDERVPQRTARGAMMSMSSLDVLDIRSLCGVHHRGGHRICSKRFEIIAGCLWSKASFTVWKTRVLVRQSVAGVEAAVYHCLRVLGSQADPIPSLGVTKIRPHMTRKIERS